MWIMWVTDIMSVIMDTVCPIETALNNKNEENRD